MNLLGKQLGISADTWTYQTNVINKVDEVQSSRLDQVVVLQVNLLVVHMLISSSILHFHTEIDLLQPRFSHLKTGETKLKARSAQHHLNVATGGCSGAGDFDQAESVFGKRDHTIWPD